MHGGSRACHLAPPSSRWVCKVAWSGKHGAGGSTVIPWQGTVASLREAVATAMLLQGSPMWRSHGALLHCCRRAIFGFRWPRRLNLPLALLVLLLPLRWLESDEVGHGVVSLEGQRLGRQGSGPPAGS